eukprot:TRINITY_DN2254_c0_g1_i2.p1 TRINITY_DN2254_c0_g1~~TRINITY_DN2254_c0_g1_i2.p1  ORF type:complete len:696 (+),score=183.90 TRINITY_DN2254_c0_g1_i2:123-2210(+)
MSTKEVTPKPLSKTTSAGSSFGNSIRLVGDVFTKIATLPVNAVQSVSSQVASSVSAATSKASPTTNAHSTASSVNLAATQATNPAKTTDKPTPPQQVEKTKSQDDSGKKKKKKKLKKEDENAIKSEVLLSCNFQSDEEEELSEEEDKGRKRSDSSDSKGPVRTASDAILVFHQEGEDINRPKPRSRTNSFGTSPIPATMIQDLLSSSPGASLSSTLHGVSSKLTGWIPSISSIGIPSYPATATTNGGSSTTPPTGGYGIFHSIPYLFSTNPHPPNGDQLEARESKIVDETQLREEKYKSFVEKVNQNGNRHGKSLKDNMDRFVEDFLTSLSLPPPSPKESPTSPSLSSSSSSFPSLNSSLSEEDQFVRGQGRRVHTFIDSMLEDYCLPVWGSNKAIDDSQVADCIEKYVTDRIYHRAFALTDRDLLRDMEIHQRIASLHFLQKSHLDVLVDVDEYEEKWNRAQEALLNLNSFKSPQEKLHSILLCSKYLFEILREDRPNKSFAADEFLPLLIFTILKANPPNLHSNIQYLANFRHPSKMLAESGYYFISFLTAVTFIESADSSRLSIDPVEFEKGINRNSMLPGTPRNEQGESEKEPVENTKEIQELKQKEQTDQQLAERKLGDSAESSSKILSKPEPEMEDSTIAPAPSTRDPEYFLKKKPEDYSTEDVRDLIEDYRRILSVLSSLSPKGNSER